MGSGFGGSPLLERRELDAGEVFADGHGGGLGDELVEVTAAGLGGAVFHDFFSKFLNFERGSGEHGPYCSKESRVARPENFGSINTSTHLLVPKELGLPLTERHAGYSCITFVRFCQIFSQKLTGTDIIDAWMLTCPRGGWGSGRGGGGGRTRISRGGGDRRTMEQRATLHLASAH